MPNLLNDTRGLRTYVHILKKKLTLIKLNIVNHLLHGSSPHGLPGLMSQSVLLWDRVRLEMKRVVKCHTRINIFPELSGSWNLYYCAFALTKTKQQIRHILLPYTCPPFIAIRFGKMRLCSRLLLVKLESDQRESLSLLITSVR